MGGLSLNSVLELRVVLRPWLELLVAYEQNPLTVVGAEFRYMRTAPYNKEGE